MVYLYIEKHLHSRTSQQQHRHCCKSYICDRIVKFIHLLNHGGEVVRPKRSPRPSPPVPHAGPHQPAPPVRQAARRPQWRPVHPGGDPFRDQLDQADPKLGPRRRHLRRLRRARARRARRDGRPLLRADRVGRVRDAGRAPAVGVGAGAARASGGVRRVRAVGAARGAARRPRRSSRSRAPWTSCTRTRGPAGCRPRRCAQRRCGTCPGCRRSSRSATCPRSWLTSGIPRVSGSCC